MGAKGSKFIVISYEEAQTIVSEDELRRLKDAFTRCSNNEHMSRAIFDKDVLGDGVPGLLSEKIYMVFGGNGKGISFKDLFCGLAVLAKGSLDQKMRLIFALHCNDSCTYISRCDMERLVRVCEGGSTPMSLYELFLLDDQVTFDHFRDWCLKNIEALSITKWLLKEANTTMKLSDDNETPTFYQTLAGVTHLEEREIMGLEKHYWTLKSQSKTGKLDLQTFTDLTSPPLPAELLEGVFNAFDENKDGHIDFKEMACGISASSRGPVTERLKFSFKIFDKDQDGLLSQSELYHMIDILLRISLEYSSQDISELDSLDANTVVDNIISVYDSDNDNHITQEEFLVWALNQRLPREFMKLLFEICHVVLGLKPSCSKEEGEVICGWLDRENCRGKCVGDTWYLVSIGWWTEWYTYVSFKIQMLQSTSITDLLVPVSTTTSHPNPPSTPTSPSNTPQKHPPPPPNSNTPTGGGPVVLTPLTPSSTTHPSRPGPINNSSLVEPETRRVLILTTEGGRLRRDITLAQGKEFQLLPEPVWKALALWYGGTPALPRTVVNPGEMKTNTPELELYPITVLLYRHVAPSRTITTWATQAMGTLVGNSTSHQTGYSTGSGGGVGGVPKRYLAYQGSFSRKSTLKQVFQYLCNRLRIRTEDMRLWDIKDENNARLFEEEDLTLEALSISDNHLILIEVRNRDLTWPEEISSIHKHRCDRGTHGPGGTTERGVTGLSNLGNTCFMNSALQCISNTRPLTVYFSEGTHLYELNRSNPLGMKGHIAKRYGDLVQDLWSGTSRTVAPLKLRWTIGKYAPRFSGFQQHDCQELLAFLLDGLHEDLNRVHIKPYVELKDSDGRPDSDVANEAWENHILRNRSIIVDLFHGLLKSEVQCKQCSHISVRFDPFSYLSLPIPMENYINIDILVMLLDGSVPVKYGFRFETVKCYRDVKSSLSNLCGLPSVNILLVEVLGSNIKCFPDDRARIRIYQGSSIVAYELSNQYTVLRSHDSDDISDDDCDDIGSGTLNETVASATPGAEGAEVVDVREGSGVTEVGDCQTSFVSDRLLQSPNLNRVAPPPVLYQNGPVPSARISTSNHLTPLNTSQHATTSQWFHTLGNNQVSGCIIALHRKMVRMDVFFLSHQRCHPSLFGCPLVIPVLEQSTHADLYAAVWCQVSRFVSPLPPADSTGGKNHAQDCDYSLGTELPFTLRAVRSDCLTCAWCPWFLFCKGCQLGRTTKLFNYSCQFITIDWDPTALHLRYQSSTEKSCIEHVSISDRERLTSEPIDLQQCLTAFTKQEQLGPDQLYYCSKCRQHQLASKQFTIWKMPPILIVHLKRFQLVNERWMKSHKIVKFPKTRFDPYPFLDPDGPHVRQYPSPTKHTDANCNNQRTTHTHSNHHGNPVLIGGHHDDIASEETRDSLDNQTSNRPRETEDEGGTDDRPCQINGFSSGDHPPMDQTGFSHCAEEGCHRLNCGQCTIRPTYDLYAISSHSGIMGGGHYISYARNPNGKWYYYNDSSCKEVNDSDIDSNSAYMLFYEQRHVDYAHYMPDISNKEIVDITIDDELDEKRMCSIQ